MTRRSRYRQKPLAQQLADSKRALQGLENLTGKAVMDPRKRDPWTPAAPANKQNANGDGGK